MSREIMQQALDALIWHEEQDEEIRYNDCFSHEAIEALRQELAKPEQKQECETCAAKRKRLTDAGLLKSPLRQELAKPEQAKSIWILTREINQYDQDGEYFVGAWNKKPTHQQLTELGVPQDRLHIVLDGGGRVYPEEEWFYLKEQK